MRQLSQTLVGTLLAALPGAAIAAEPIRSAFGPGEQSVFEVSYLGVPTGTAVITVGLKMQQFGQDVWPIVCTAQTDLAIYPVRDRYVSYWDYVGRVNIGSDFFIDEGKKRRRERFRYDREHQQIFATKHKESSPPVELTYEAPPGVVDLAGAAMLLRNRALNVGDEVELPIFTGSLTYPMKTRVEGKETIATRLGERGCLKVSFTAQWSGMLAPKRALTLWVLDDATHLPIRFEAELMLGSVVAELTTFYPGRDYTR